MCQWNKTINLAVKRNIERFPESFMFQLTNEEYDNLGFQSGTSKVRGGRRYNPYENKDIKIIISITN